MAIVDIFISYARRDGAELALVLQKDLRMEGYEVWLDTQRIGGAATWTVEIEAAIDRAQVVLALLTPGSYSSHICRAEQLRSLRKGKCVIPLLAAPGSDIPLHLEPKNYRDFSEKRTYTASFRSLVTDIETRSKSARKVRADTRGSQRKSNPQQADEHCSASALRFLCVLCVSALDFS
jgi:hypothetical protein